MSKRKTVPWHKRGRLFVVNPNWNFNAELTFTEKEDMIAWAHNNGYILKDVTLRA